MKRSGLEPQSRIGGSAGGHDSPLSSPVPRSGREPQAVEGDASPTVSTASVAAAKSSSRPDSDFTASGVLKSEAMKATHQAWADEQITLSSCAFCDWTHEGSAGEGRAEARAHRERAHPEACIKKPRMRKRISKRQIRSADEEEQIAVDAAEANRLRRERDEATMLAKIERGRERDAAALAALDMAEVTV